MTKYRDGSADLYQEPGLACRLCRVTRLLPSTAKETCQASGAPPACTARAGPLLESARSSVSTQAR
jgi:hypothetical protein